MPRERTEKHQANSGNDKWEPHRDPPICSFKLRDRKHHAGEEEDRPGILEDIEFHKERCFKYKGRLMSGCFTPNVTGQPRLTVDLVVEVDIIEALRCDDCLGSFFISIEGSRGPEVEGKHTRLRTER